jgi:hypothetical protein
MLPLVEVSHATWLDLFHVLGLNAGTALNALVVILRTSLAAAATFSKSTSKSHYTPHDGLGRVRELRARMGRLQG